MDCPRYIPPSHHPSISGLCVRPTLECDLTFTSLLKHHLLNEDSDHPHQDCNPHPTGLPICLTQLDLSFLLQNVYYQKTLHCGLNFVCPPPQIHILKA